MITLSTILKPVLRLSADEFPKIAARQFGAHNDIDRVWQDFAPVAHTLVDSFWTTVDHPRFATLVPMLDATDDDVRGVAYEGAGMGLSLLDCLLPYKKRLADFLTGPGRAYKPLLYIGAGLALPRMPVDPLRIMARYDDDDRWLILDGYGFYYGFFTPERSLRQQVRPRRITGYAGQMFDRGLGRSLWFTSAANTQRIAAVIGRFPAARRGDLWSGVGLACAYAAGVLDEPAMRRLVTAAGPDADQFAVGVAVAAEFRHVAGHSAGHTDLACAISWGADSATVARIATAERAGTAPLDMTTPRYEAWRQGVRTAWTARHQDPTTAARADQ
ncbi:DUF1702 family protein [Streptomyces sp. NBC_00847]|uniref:DUF1702 family protein n=1 Tax=Streptomyces sp. NBC_00847 TaxID=2975850 RepID=UPI002255DF53|nr:DUF1702 family protein [Streptomyces sp. NBC_00847]MCX4884622.1 DUF1702 family protein [Streptomyces sp. NBC_00847]